MRLQRLQDWATDAGLHPETVRRWAREGKMPVETIKTASGQWMVKADPALKPEPVAGETVAYARVSSHDQKADLDAQVGRIITAYGKGVDRVVTEIGSGMNGGRKKINALLADPGVTTIVVEHRDRLARINVPLIESALAAAGRELVVLDESETESDLVSDIIDFMTSACARLYGQRGAKNRARKAVEAMGQEG